MSTDNNRWVLEYAKCNLNDVLESLMKLVERDISDINNLPGQKRGFATFGIRDKGDLGRDAPPQIVRSNGIGQEVLYTFTLTPNEKIAVETPTAGKPTLTLHLDWHAMEGQCLVLVALAEEKSPCKITVDDLWRISQHLLKPFLA